VMLYQKTIDQWNKDPILAAKEIVKVIAKELELGKVTFEKPDISRFRLHPKKQAIITLAWSGKHEAKSQNIWFIGALHPLILQNNKIGETSGVVYLSLNITAIIENITETREHIYKYETLQDQIIWRDLCFVVDANKSFDPILTAVQNVPEIQDIEVFDVYAGKNLGEDKKSVSIKIKIVGDSNSTKDGASMTTEQINDIMKKAIAAGETAGGSLRA